MYVETSVSKATSVALSARMAGSGSLRSVSMYMFGRVLVFRAWRIVARMERWRVRRTRVLRVW
jgi:hypothetical protein